jgi:hypothetical protein
MPPRSIVVNPTTPSNTLSFALPPGVTIDVESVLAAIDASAAGDTTATLTIADSSGAVIARKAQTQVVAAGTNPGSATWALRLADEQVAAPVSGGDYVFVQELTANGGQNDLTFAVPQDARHLVLSLHYAFANSVPLLTFNGDNASGSYRTLYSTLQDFNGAVTNTDTSLTAQNAIKLAGMDAETCRATITIPYYRDHVPAGAGGVWFGRSCEIESWDETENPVSVVSLVRHVKQSGFWLPAGPPADPAITTLNLFVSGGVARAALYKIM